MAINTNDLLEERAYAKLTRRLLPFLFVCYVFSYLDRVNIGFAKLQMLDDLGLSETVYGLGAGLFFAGYVLFGVPSNLIMVRVGARVWIASIMIAWGLVAMAMMFVTTPIQFYLLRFLLGAAEAGFIPGILFYLTSWFPSARRGRISALFLTGIPVSGVIGGPLSGWIMQSFSDLHGMYGWQWLFVIEGFPSFLLGILTFFYLPDGIHSATWLTQPERNLLEQRIQMDTREMQYHSLGHVFAESKVWLLAIIYALFLLGLYGVSFWLPSLIKATGVGSPLNVGILSAIPYVAAVIGMILIGHHSDRRLERRWHLALPGFLGGIGLALSTLATDSPTLAIAALTLGTAGACTIVSQFWNLPSAFLAGVAAAAGIAFVNSAGNISGLVAPYLIGWIKDTTGRTDAALWVIAGCMMIAGCLVFLIPARLVNK